MIRREALSKSTLKFHYVTAQTANTASDVHFFGHPINYSAGVAIQPTSCQGGC